MASAAKNAEGLGAPGDWTKGKGVPVILDGGTSVRVAAIEFDAEPCVGLRFDHDGAMWEITRAQDHARGWVARPVRARARSAWR